MFEAYTTKLTELDEPPNKRPGSNFVVPRIETLEEELADVASDVSDGDDDDEKTPTQTVTSGRPPAPVFPTYPPRGRRKSLPNVFAGGAKNGQEEFGGSEARLEAVKKIDKKVQRLARQKSKSSPADVIELRSINNTPGPGARFVTSFVISYLKIGEPGFE